MKVFKQLKGKKMLAFCLLFALFIACVIGLSSVNRSKTVADDITLGETNVESEYSVGETLTLTDVTLTVNGQEVTASPIVYYPNGSASASKEIELTQKGKYVIEYGATVDGEYVSANKEFGVYEYVAANSSTGEPLEYVKSKVTVMKAGTANSAYMDENNKQITDEAEISSRLTAVNDALSAYNAKVIELGYNSDEDKFYDGSVEITDEAIIAEKRAELDASYAALTEARSKITNFTPYTNQKVTINGLKLSLKAGEVAEYKKIIDLSKATINDNLFTFEGTPLVNGKQEAKSVYFRFTDVYDSSNYITIRAKLEPSPEAYYYVDNKGNVTYYPNSDKDYSYLVASYGTEHHVGGEYVDHANYGAGCRNGFNGKWSSVHEAITVHLDYKNKQIWSTYQGEKQLIVDFNEAYTTPWAGFTTGECYFSVWADNYTSVDVNSTFNGVITSIFGQKLNDGVGADGGAPLLKVDSTKAPSIDFKEYKELSNIPNAMVGQPYTVFDSYGYSVYVEKPAEVKVYFGYYSSSKYALPIVDGKFTPKVDGIHTIEYTVTDIFGNSATTLVDVYAMKKVETFTFDVPDTESYTSGDVGFVFNVPAPDATTLSGNLGTVTFSALARHSDGSEVAIINGSFVPLKAGEWTIVYTAIDAVERKAEFTYKANVELGDKVVFDTLKDLSNYFIVGAKNPIPALGVIDYTDGGTTKNAETIFVEKNGAKVADVTDGYFTPQSEGEYTLVYQSKSSLDVINQERYVITAVDVGFTSQLDVGNYFYSEGKVSSEVTDSGIVYTVKGNSTIDFIRPTDGVQFAFSFNALAESASKINAITLYISDINNAEQSISIRLAKTSSGNFISINGEKERTLELYSIGGTADFPVKISSGQILIGRNLFLINSYLNGEEYNGFESNLVNLSLVVETASNLTEVKLRFSEIAGQKLNVTTDGISPRLVTPEPVENRYLPEEVIKIAGISVLDVLDPYVKATLTVTDKSRNPIKDINGVTLKDVDVTKDYYIQPGAMGQYRIVYVYEDSRGNGTGEFGRASIFNVITRELPVITLPDASTSAKLGDTYIIKTATVTSFAEKVEQYILVQTPTGKLKELDRNNKTGEYIMELKLDQKGEYLIRYMALDEYGNMSIADYTIRVA